MRRLVFFIVGLQAVYINNKYFDSLTKIRNDGPESKDIQFVGGIDSKLDSEPDSESESRDEVTAVLVESDANITDLKYTMLKLLNVTKGNGIKGVDLQGEFGGEEGEEFGTKGEERKFRNLKILILWLQRGSQFGRYCYYGCFCLPEGSHKIANGGYGKPVDTIDRSCFRFKQCYRCLVDEHMDGEGLPKEPKSDTYDGKCRGEDLGYKYELRVKFSGKKIIKCMDKTGSCRRNICECDKRLAEDLAFYEDEWDEYNHALRGGFDRDRHCKKAVSPYKFEECCGDRYTFPFNQPKKDNQCCEGPAAKPKGTCSAV